MSKIMVNFPDPETCPTCGQIVNQTPEQIAAWLVETGQLVTGHVRKVMKQRERINRWRAKKALANKD